MTYTGEFSFNQLQLHVTNIKQSAIVIISDHNVVSILPDSSLINAI